MKRLINIYLTGAKCRITAGMAYRLDFLVNSTVLLLSDMFLPLITVLIYGSGMNFNDWTMHEILVIQGIFMMAKGTATILFFQMIYDILVRVREGTFDLVLLKPSSPLFLSVTNAFEIEGFGTLVGGIIITIYSVIKVGNPGFINYFSAFIVFIISIVTMFSFSMLMSSTVFKWVGNGRVYEIFDTITMFGNYPRTIFSKAFQNIISYIIPVALIGYYPAAVLLGKSIDGLVVSCVVSIIFMFFSLWIWKVMLGKYASAGG